MLMGENEYRIRTAINSDRSRIANLIHFGSSVHQHLDWVSPLEWIGKQPYLVLEKREDIHAALACPPDLPEITWIRLFAVSSKTAADEAWKILWQASRDMFLESGKMLVAALSMQGWFSEILEVSKFWQTDTVIVLVNERSSKIPEPNDSSVKIRLMVQEDIPTVLEIDNSAFSLEWRNSREAMERAFQQSSYTTVAEMGDEIVGYQYSTSSGIGGHLARLAVKVPVQGKGIGYSLVYNVVKQFREQGATNISVNTQQSNIASLALYAKAGFKTVGESYQVYRYIL
jgi:ribosomal-protein-alanine N-acetyltransferase